jgi:hypothetical protein
LAPRDATSDDAVEPARSCTSATGTADITARMGGQTTTYTRLYAGGIWNTGPVAPVVAASMSVELVITDAAPVSAETGLCCSGPTDCCPLQGLGMDLDPLLPGAEIGTHVVRIRALHDATFTLTGTITITDFVHPFEQAPGRIAGSVSASTGNRSVSGTLDNEFCAALLNQTI